MTKWIPVSDPPPPDDHHTWAKPAPDDCPNCECCSARLCATANDKGVSCRTLSRESGSDLNQCPCVGSRTN